MPQPLDRRLRSASWFGPDTTEAFIHRAWLGSQGYTRDVFDGRPVIGVANSWSETTNCNAHLRDLAEHVKRGVWRAGGFPMEFPVISLGEALMKPTTMLIRNLMSMDVEESIRAYPFDGVVLLSGCDKTTVAMLMGAASADVPAIMVTGGPMLRGLRGTKELPSGTAVWEAADDRRAGTMTDEQWFEMESCITRSNGHCGVMGTASTMAAMAEALGMTLPGNAAIPAVDARRKVHAELTGSRIVDAAREGLRPSEILTRDAFENAITVDMSIGGSTNAVIHLVALARRAGVDLPLALFDEISRRTPLLANVRPSGAYQMEDFYYAGGLPAVLAQLLPVLHGDARTINGRSLGENVEGVSILDKRVISRYDAPLAPEGGTVILYGNVCPDGAVLKQSAATPSLLQHRGRAVVFRDREDLAARIDDPALDVDEGSILVLQGVGPIGAPGMPVMRSAANTSEAPPSGGARHGPHLRRADQRHVIRDPRRPRRSGSGGRRPAWLDPRWRHHRARHPWPTPDGGRVRRRIRPPPHQPPRGNPKFKRGYARLYEEHVLQANEGVDLDFLVGRTKVLLIRLSRSTAEVSAGRSP